MPQSIKNILEQSVKNGVSDVVTSGRQEKLPCRLPVKSLVRLPANPQPFFWQDNALLSHELQEDLARRCGDKTAAATRPRPPPQPEAKIKGLLLEYYH